MAKRFKAQKSSYYPAYSLDDKEDEECIDCDGYAEGLDEEDKNI